MPDENEEGFTVRDRRRFLSEEPPAPADAPAAEPGRERGEAAAAQTFNDTPPAAGNLDDEEFSQDNALPDVYAFLAMFLGELRNLAWFRMGLVANPGTGQIERDLSQAKVAIDTVAFLASQIESVVPAEERLPLRALVSDLQINFVEQNKKG